eukprot:m.122939 g.122939  ORF g.122939 m.122939 type:complete len:4233 (+) comp28949_c0_seq1:341-13039(+)
MKMGKVSALFTVVVAIAATTWLSAVPASAQDADTIRLVYYPREFYDKDRTFPVTIAWTIRTGAEPLVMKVSVKSGSVGYGTATYDVDNVGSQEFIVDLERDLPLGEEMKVLCYVTKKSSPTWGNKYVNDVKSDFVIVDHRVEATEEPHDDPITISLPAQDITVESDGLQNAYDIEKWVEINGNALAIGCEGVGGHIFWSIGTMQNWVEGACTGEQTLEIKFNAKDSCGQQISTKAKMHVVDRSAPIFTKQARNQIFEPDSEITPAVLDEILMRTHGLATANDVASDVTWSWNYEHGDKGFTSRSISTTTKPGCVSKVFPVRINAIDDCGNVASTTANVTFDDTKAPVLTHTPTNLEVEFDTTTNAKQVADWVDAHGGASAIDAAGSDMTWTVAQKASPKSTDVIVGDYYFAVSSSIEGTDATPDIFAVFVFTITDDCGNSVTVEGKVVVLNSRRALSQGAQDVVVESDGRHNGAELQEWLISNGNAKLDPTVDADTTIWTYEIDGIGFVPINPETKCQDDYIPVTFTAQNPSWTDPVLTKANFLVKDTVAPIMITQAQQLAARKISDFERWLEQHGGATATDESDTVVWTYDQVDMKPIAPGDHEDMCYANFTEVTFTASDLCGNTATTTAIFYLIDTIAPDVRVGANDMTVALDTENVQQIYEDWVTDNAGAKIYQQQKTEPNGVTWSATNVPITYVGIHEGCPNQAATVTFTVTDACGNSADTIATFSVSDSSPPEVKPKSRDVTVEADGNGNKEEFDAWVASNGNAHSQDADCVFSHVVGATTTADSNVCPNPETEVEFKASDICGNTLNMPAVFRIVDSQPPIFETECVDLRVEKDPKTNAGELDAWIANHGGGIASDVGGGVVEWSNSDAILRLYDADSGCTNMIATVVFSVTDGCGNTATSTASFYIVDSTPSQFIHDPEDRTVQLDPLTNPTDLESWVATNANAEMDSVVTWSATVGDFISETEGCGSATAEVVFTATDYCGNKLSKTANFNAVDTVAPIFVGQAKGITVEDGNDSLESLLGEWLSANGNAGATDKYSDPVTWSYTMGAFNHISPNPLCTSRSGLVTFSATDKCGNVATSSAHAIIQDSTPPTIQVAPSDVTVEIGADGTFDEAAFTQWVSSNAGGKATDMFATPTWTSDIVGKWMPVGAADHEESCISSYKLGTFTVTDACGSSVASQAKFFTVDSTPPTIDVAATAKVVESDGKGNSAEFTAFLNAAGGAAASDATSNSITWSHTQADEWEYSADGKSKVLHITFVATDDCGNKGYAPTTFTIQDLTPPTIRSGAIDVSVELIGEDSYASVLQWLAQNGSASAADVGLDDGECLTEIRRNRRQLKYGQHFGTGRSKRQACFCNEYDQPICGSNKKTYANPCWAYCEEMYDFTDGACAEAHTPTTPPPTTPSPTTPSPTTPPPTDKPTAATTCVDGKASCNVWAMNDFCNPTGAYFGYMNLNCKKSCDFCGPAPTHKPTPSPSNKPTIKPTHATLKPTPSPTPGPSASPTSKECLDLSVWRDSYQRGCQDYSDLLLCQKGTYGSTWSSKHTFDTFATNGVDAGQACCACGGGNYDMELIETAPQSCNALGLTPTTDPKVCAFSFFGKNCYADTYSYNDANAMCHNKGARLCSVDELFRDVTAGTGCGMDNKRVWSSSACGGGHVLAAGALEYNALIPPVCAGNDDKSGSVRCCADVGEDREVQVSIPTSPPTAPSVLEGTGPAAWIKLLVTNNDVVEGVNTMSFDVQYEARDLDLLVFQAKIFEGDDEATATVTVGKGSSRLEPPAASGVQSVDLQLETNFDSSKVYKIMVYVATRGAIHWGGRLSVDTQFVICRTNSPTTPEPSPSPSSSPTPNPTSLPTVSQPTRSPTPEPTTSKPTKLPTSAPSTSAPTGAPTYTEGLTFTNPGVITPGSTSIVIDVTWSTNLAHAQIRPSLKVQGEAKNIASKEAIVLPAGVNTGTTQITLQPNTPIEEGDYVIYLYIVDVDGTWGDRTAFQNMKVVVSATATAEPTAKPTLRPTLKPTVKPTQKGSPTAKPVGKPQCPDTSLGFFWAELNQRMTNQRQFILQKTLTETAEACASECLAWNTDSANEGQAQCKSFERRPSNNVCALKAVSPGDDGIELVENTKFNTYILQGLDCVDMNSLRPTPPPTAAHTSPTSNPDGGGDDGKPCPDYIQRFSKVEDLRFRMGQKNILRVIGLREIGVTTPEGCAEICIHEGTGCKSFEYKVKNSLCTLKTIGEGEIGTMVKTGFDLYLRDMTACTGPPTEEQDGTDNSKGNEATTQRNVATITTVTTETATITSTTGTDTTVTSQTETSQTSSTSSTYTGVITYNLDADCACNEGMHSAVCASGKDYFNPCYAFCDNEIVYAIGTCRQNGVAEHHYELTTVRPTEADEEREEEETTEPPTTETADSCFCDLSVYMPVCGKKSYHSMCFALCENDLDFFAGACPTSITETTVTATTQTYTSVTTVTAGPVCFCDGTYEPVCARGITSYQNPCYAACYKDFIYNAGPCGSCGTVEWTNSVQDLPSLSDILAMGCLERTVPATFTVTDGAGGQATTDAVFTFVDTTAPVLSSPPSDKTIETTIDGDTLELDAWLNSGGGADIFDSGGIPIITHLDLNFKPLVEGSSCTDKHATTEFTVQDQCGNEVKASATVTTKDTTPPQITSSVVDLTVQSFETDDVITSRIESWLQVHGEAVAVDTVSTELQWSHSGVQLDPSFPGTACASKHANVKFTVGDDCGNTVTLESVLHVADTIAPHFSNPTLNFTVETDGLGNVAQVIEWLQGYGLTKAKDEVTADKDIKMAYTNSEQIIIGQENNDESDTCQNAVVYAQFTATDLCGNVATSPGEFKMVDTTKPIIDREASPLVVEADGSGNSASIQSWLAVQGSAFARDSISTHTWVNDYTTGSFNFANPDFEQDTAGSQQVAFTAVDACGNSETSVATLTIQDTVAPEIVSTATSVTVEADADGNVNSLKSWLANYGGATATDNSHHVVWTHTSATKEDFVQIDPESRCKDETLAVTFTASDPTGNAVDVTTTFTIVDTTLPVLVTAASNVLIESAGAEENDIVHDNWLANHGGAEISDVRKGIMWEFTSTDFVGHAEAGSCGNRTSTTTFIANDGCGNSVSTTATFTIVDTQGPDIVAEASDTTIQSDGRGNRGEIKEWLRAHGNAVVLDKDDTELTWTNTNLDFTTVGTDEDCLSQWADIEFTAVDRCGFSVKTDARLTIADTAPPVFTQEAMTLTVSPTDGPVLITNNGVVDLANENTVSLLNWIETKGGAVAEDMVTGPHKLVWTYSIPPFKAVSSNSKCNDKYIAVNFTATDLCGLHATTTARYEMIDGSKPVIASPAVSAIVDKNTGDVDSKLASWISRNGNAIALDNGSPVDIEWSAEQPEFQILHPGSACGDDMATVQFKAMDTCDNTVTSTANFSRVDTIAPVLELEAVGVTFEHDGQGNTLDVAAWLNSNGGAVATDAVGQVLWTNTPIEFVKSRPNSECPDESATVVFTADDGCGNTVDTTATVSLVDSSLPVLLKPPSNQSVDADGSGNVLDLQNWLAAHGGAEANKPMTWVFTPPVFDIATCSGRSAMIMFTGTDMCGHTLQTSAKFSIQDLTPPAFTVEAQDVTVQADWTGNEADLQIWIDNHGGAVVKNAGSSTLTWSHRLDEDEWTMDEGLPTCTTDKHRTITFVVIDTCGQIAATSATFTIKDMAPPSIGCNSLIELRCDYRCEENLAFDEFLQFNGHLCIDDVSGYETTHNFPVDQFPNFLLDVCGTAGTVTFTVTDGCGNTVSESVDYSVAQETPMCDACADESKGTHISSLTFMWIPGFNSEATTNVDVSTGTGAVTTVEDTSQLEAGDTFTTLLSTVGGNFPLVVAVKVADIKIRVPVTCNSNLSLTTTYDFGEFGFHGQIKLVAFTRSDGASSDSCGEKAKCDTGLCLDINVCTDGAYSLQHLTFMYLGHNPDVIEQSQFSQGMDTTVITQPGPQGLSPTRLYISKYEMTDDDLRNVKIGDEITINKFEKEPGSGFRFPGYLNIRINSDSRVKFDTTCKEQYPLRVGDRYGSILITGYKSDHAKQCHIRYRVDDFIGTQNGAMAVVQSDDEVSGGADAGVGVVMLGVGFGLVAVVLLAAAVLLNKRTKSFTYSGDGSETQSTQSSVSARSRSSHVIEVPVAKPRSGKAGVTAMDLINRHHFDDDDSSTIVSESDMSQREGTMVSSAMEWDNQVKIADDSTAIHVQ